MLKEAAEGRKRVRLVVLILILMEHAQRGLHLLMLFGRLIIVLILILMEHAQREHFL